MTSSTLKIIACSTVASALTVNSSHVFGDSNSIWESVFIGLAAAIGSSAPAIFLEQKFEHKKRDGK